MLYVSYTLDYALWKYTIIYTVCVLVIRPDKTNNMYVYMMFTISYGVKCEQKGCSRFSKILRPLRPGNTYDIIAIINKFDDFINTLSTW